MVRPIEEKLSYLATHLESNGIKIKDTLQTPIARHGEGHFAISLLVENIVCPRGSINNDQKNV